MQLCLRTVKYVIKHRAKMEAKTKKQKCNRDWVHVVVTKLHKQHRMIIELRKSVGSFA